MSEWIPPPGSATARLRELAQKLAPQQTDMSCLVLLTEIALKDALEIAAAPAYTELLRGKLRDTERELSDLRKDQLSALRHAHDVTLETQNASEAIFDLVRIVRDSRKQRDTAERERDEARYQGAQDAADLNTARAELLQLRHAERSAALSALADERATIMAKYQIESDVTVLDVVERMHLVCMEQKRTISDLRSDIDRIRRVMRKSYPHPGERFEALEQLLVERK